VALPGTIGDMQPRRQREPDPSRGRQMGQHGQHVVRSGRKRNACKRKRSRGAQRGYGASATSSSAAQRKRVPSVGRAVDGVGDEQRDALTGCMSLVAPSMRWVDEVAARETHAVHPIRLADGLLGAC
jgi:hypothetical protein